MNVASNGPVVRENNSVVPLSVEAEEFSLATVLNVRVPAEEGSHRSGNCIPSREMLEGIVRWGGAVVSTTVGAGAATPVVLAGAVAPADLGRTDVPAVVRMNFSAVTEMYSRPLVIKAFP